MPRGEKTTLKPLNGGLPKQKKRSKPQGTSKSAPSTPKSVSKSPRLSLTMLDNITESLKDASEDQASQQDYSSSTANEVVDHRPIVFSPNPGPQTAFLSAMEREVLLGGAAGGGKAQPHYAKVATPYGWIPMGDIKVGDEVCTPDGKYASVMQVHPQGVLDVFTFTFQDGSTCEATDDHLWMSKPIRDGACRWKVRTTRALRKSHRDFVVPLGYVEREARELPMHPYALGCLLGDGGITTNSVSFTTADLEMIDNLQEYVKVVKRSAKYAYVVYAVVPTLQSMGLLGLNSHTKFIPDEYLVASLEQRYALIQGLLDTDGYVSVDGKVNYTSMSPVMLNQMAELIRSVGGTSTLMLNKHTIYIRHPDSAKLFRLERKKARCHKKVINNRIVSIELTGRTEAICITLDNVDQLYCTDNYLVTHNSYAMLADPVRYFDNPNFNGLLLRHTTEELRELVQKSQQLYPQIVKGIKWSERKMQWTAPSGASLWLSYLDRDADVMRYQGQAFSWIGFDELTQWGTPFAWDYMRSRLRSTDSTLDLCMRATTNPGGPGHSWVKKYFIDPSPPNVPFSATDLQGHTLLYPKGHKKEGQHLFKRVFIPATLFDNPYLAKDGEYEANLLSLPEHERRRLLYGDWDVAEGAAFSEFRRDLHVVQPYDIPHGWIKFRACDYGYGSATGVLWFALTPEEQLVVYRELYCTGVTAVDLADQILQLERDDSNLRYGVLDSSLWHQRGDTGPSLAEQMINRGCRWRPSDRSKGSRVAGKNEIHRRLQADEYTEEAGLIFFSTCTNIIAQLPVLPLDKNNPDDVDTKSEDHLYDALRYGVMTRPKYSIFDYNVDNHKAKYRPADSTFGY